MTQGNFVGVMGRNFSKLSSHIMAFDNAVQASMYRYKMIPDAGGQYWGALQVIIRLRKKCMGTPVISIYPYKMTFKINGGHQAVQHPGALPGATGGPAHLKISTNPQQGDRPVQHQLSQDSHEDHDPTPLIIIIVVIARGARRARRHATSPTVSHATASSVRRLSLGERKMTTTMRISV